FFFSHHHVTLQVFVGGLAIEVQKLFNVKNGQQASITCKYDRYYKDYVKYWCRGYYRNSCSVVVTTSGKLQQGSVTIKDERDRSEILVTISDLKLEDSNWYWCGIEISQWRDKMDYTKINVTEGKLSIMNLPVLSHNYY
uniref:Immunoglobulin domain-containing protein n=1 Tax=Latimeria chalumnae TaxID=7897 RepID=H3BGX4_LATCH